MGILAVVVFVVLVVLAIIISVQESTIKKLNKQNKEQAYVIVGYKKHDDVEIAQLTSYLTQNPLDAMDLLKSHVETMKNRAKNNS